MFLKFNGILWKSNAWDFKSTWITLHGLIGQFKIYYTYIGSGLLDLSGLGLAGGISLPDISQDFGVQLSDMSLTGIGINDFFIWSCSNFTRKSNAAIKDKGFFSSSTLFSSTDSSTKLESMSYTNLLKSCNLLTASSMAPGK